MPNVEIRPATAEELPAVAFNASRQMGLPPSMFQGMVPEWTICAFVDGELATTYAAWPLTIRFNGNPAPMAGVTWVSTHPAHRRRGYLRAITNAHFQAMHERRAQAIAGLHPAWVAIYRRYGYGTITARHSYQVEPRDIRFAHPLEVPGTIRELDIETEFGTLVDVYRRYREDRNGLVHRGRAMWDSGPTAPPPPNHVKTVYLYEEGGVAQGYVIVHTGPGPSTQLAGGGQTLTVEDLFAITPAAHRAIWTLLSGFDNVRHVVYNNAPPDDPLVHTLVEPRLLNIKRQDGIMARLVTVEDALAQRPYPLEAVLRFELKDDLCPWNDGRWELSTGLEGGQARRTDASPDLTLTPDVLAMLAFGHVSTTDAARAGLVDGADGRLLRRWDDALRTKYIPHEAEHTW